LRLTPTARPGRPTPDGGRREFLEFVIDDLALGDAVRTRAASPVMADVISVLVTNWPGGFPVEDTLALLGERGSPLADHRVPLYICAECGSLGCGAVTALITRTRDLVV